jgi:hypothetical protein
VPFRDQHETEDDSAKKTRPALLESEQKEFPQKSIPPAPCDMSLEPQANFMKAGFV